MKWLAVQGTDPLIKCDFFRIFYIVSSDPLSCIEEIDNKHRRLFQMVNEAIDLAEHTEDVTTIADSLLPRLKESAATHFAHEKALMEQISYPGLEAQKRAHSAFVERLVEIDLSELDAMDDNQQEYLVNLIDFLLAWLSNHILGSDKKIGDYMRTLQ